MDKFTFGMYKEKELSIKEKVKAYDELIEKLCDFYRDYDTISNLIDVKEELANLIPELRESEDERIRRWIIDDIRFNMNNEPLNNSEYRKKAEKAIAWLEKQNSNVDNANKEYWRGYREGKQEILDKYAELEKQSEQKPAKNIVETWKDMRLEVYQQASGNRHEPNYSDDNTKMFSLNDIDEIIEKMNEQNPTDEEMVEALRTEYKKGRADAIAEMQVAWSEEDEKILNNIDITFFEEKSIPNVKYWKFMNWLKSLKDRVQPKSQWNPSKGQMEALKEVCDEHWEPDGLDPLYTLYQDLKKLKGE